MNNIPISLDKVTKHTVFGATAPYNNTLRRSILVIFLMTLAIPIQPDLGGLKLDPYRFMLLILFFPFALAILKNRAGQVTFIDVMMGCYALWIVVTLIFHHGMTRFAYGAMLGTMLLGGYMVGRLLIRNLNDYVCFIRYFIILLLILLPFAFYEFLTEHMIIGEIFSNFFPVVQKFYEKRLGFSRVQVVMPHAILFGLFCSIGFGNVIYIYRHKFFSRLVRLALVLGMTAMALSSAPLLSIALQSIMAGWDRITRGKWMILAGGATIAYVLLTLVSNRGPIMLLIDNLTFDPGTAWWRVYIWEAGVQNVINNPFFGLGLNDWVRPFWLSDTVDNFWLLTAMQSGIPGLAFIVIALVVHVLRIVQTKSLNANISDIKTGYLVVLVGTVFTLCTVHVWDAMAVFFMFYIGAGSFMYTSPQEAITDTIQGINRLDETVGSVKGNTLIYSRSYPSKLSKTTVVANNIQRIPPTYARSIKGDQIASAKLTTTDKKDNK